MIKHANDNDIYVLEDNEKPKNTQSSLKDYQVDDTKITPATLKKQKIIVKGIVQQLTTNKIQHLNKRREFDKLHEKQPELLPSKQVSIERRKMSNKYTAGANKIRHKYKYEFLLMKYQEKTLEERTIKKKISSLKELLKKRELRDKHFQH